MENLDTKFEAFIIRKQNNIFTSNVENVDLNFLKEDEILIKVVYSSLNFKDCLSINGNLGITRRYPHIPGTDASGVVVRSKSSNFEIGDKVIILASEMGQNHYGGFSQYVSVKSEWVIKLPFGINFLESMQIGTAGYTAGLAVNEIFSRCSIDLTKPILVTGSSGGIGSISILILKKIGFRVHALTSCLDKANYLRGLGVDKVITHDEILANSKMKLCKQEWQGVIDTLGGEILSVCLKKLLNNGVVVSVGNVKSDECCINVLPFILRGTSLIGINAENQSFSSKINIWDKLANEWRIDSYNLKTKIISLKDISKFSNLMFNGKIEGRVIINLMTSDE